MKRRRYTPAVVARLVLAFPLLLALCSAEAFLTCCTPWPEGGRLIERRALDPLSAWIAGKA